MPLNKLIKIHGVFLCCVILACPMYAQDTGAAKIYRDQFVQLHTKTTAILHRAEELAKGDSTDKAILNLHEEIFALTKLVHQLSEESLRSNLDEMKKGHSFNKLYFWCRLAAKK